MSCGCLAECWPAPTRQYIYSSRMYFPRPRRRRLSSCHHCSRWTSKESAEKFTFLELSPGNIYRVSQKDLDDFDKDGLKYDHFSLGQDQICYYNP